MIWTRCGVGAGVASAGLAAGGVAGAADDSTVEAEAKSNLVHHSKENFFKVIFICTIPFRVAAVQWAKGLVLTIWIKFGCYVAFQKQSKV